MTYKPSKDGTLSLAFRGIYEIPFLEIGKECDKVKHLDCSHNYITNLERIEWFTNLESLVLDHNNIKSQLGIQYPLKLKLLWVNANKIHNLSVFVEQLRKFSPKLKSLSMQNNKACPNFFNGGSPEQYADYRLFVISRLPDLTDLDVAPVTTTERELAMKTYGDLKISAPMTLIQETKEKKELEKRTSIVIASKEQPKEIKEQPIEKVEEKPIPPKVEKQVIPILKLKDEKEIAKLNLTDSIEMKEIPDRDMIPTPFKLAGQKLPLPPVQKEDDKKELPPVESSSEEDE
jgi:Leucine-rich repeat (LRR) protein